MSRQIHQPSAQVRLTNVAVVRLNKNGKRFEIACYRNKVVNYRQGLETDLSEVLQSERVFTNVSKGEFANTKVLRKTFPKMNNDDIVQLILDTGTLQVSDLERHDQYERSSREIVSWIQTHCVHPTTQRSYTLTQLRQAMKQCGYTIQQNKSIKKQALDCIKRIQQQNVLPLERAKMELLLTYPVEQDSQIQDLWKQHEIGESAIQNTVTDSDSRCSVTLLVNPSLYRPLEDMVKSGDDMKLEVLRQVVQRQGDANLETEMIEKQQRKDDEEEILLAQLKQRLSVEDDSEDDALTPVPQAHEIPDNPKKTKKLSKKAKRREKEKAAERQALIDAERQRQREREQNEPQTQSISTATTATEGASPSSTKSCTTCGGSFGSTTEYRAHFKSNWHKYNMKLKLQGVSPISKAEFETEEEFMSL